MPAELPAADCLRVIRECMDALNDESDTLPRDGTESAARHWLNDMLFHLCVELEHSILKRFPAP